MNFRRHQRCCLDITESQIHICQLTKMLAESWWSNDDATVWTFKLRKSVKFHSSGEMPALDVVALTDRHADPDNSSNSLSVFWCPLRPRGTRMGDDYTVAFHLDQHNGAFPYMVSSGTCNAIPLPADCTGGYGRHLNGICHSNSTPMCRMSVPVPCVTRTTRAKRRCPRGQYSPSSPTFSRKSMPCRTVKSTFRTCRV